MMSYADMMGLLLGFFIMLVAMSTIDKRLFGQAAQSIQDAFGLEGAAKGHSAPGRADLSQRLQSLVGSRQISLTSSSGKEGGTGATYAVQQLREGLKINGAALEFDPGSATPRDLGAAVLAGLAQEMKGHTTLVEIRGHASREALPAGGPWRDVMDLSYARAKAVGDVLAANGVEPYRIRLIACGDKESLRSGVVSPEDDASNRRVEIIVREVLADSSSRVASTRR
jgi:chemotaxis protein MotB